MELPVMKNFLCCLPLESGGRVIGWTMKIYGCFITLAMIATIVVMTNKLINNVVTDEDGNYLDSTDATDISIAILVLSIVFAHSLVTYVVATKFLNALNHRRHKHCKFFMVTIGIGVFVPFVQVYFFGLIGIPGAAIIAITFTYSFICIYYIHTMFKEEQECVTSSAYYQNNSQSTEVNVVQISQGASDSNRCSS